MSAINGIVQKSFDEDFINKIKTDLVEKNYYDDINYNIKSKSRWKIIGDITEALSHIFIGFSTILAFSSGFFDNRLLSFIAGCFGTAAFVLLRFSSYSMKESRERTEQVNILLKNLGLDPMSDIILNTMTDMTARKVIKGKSINKFDDTLDEKSNQKINQKFNEKSEEKSDKTIEEV